MNVLFLTMAKITDITESGIYTDLMRKFQNEGHHVYIIYPQERKTKRPTQLTVQDDIEILGVRTLNVTKTNIIEKGIGQVLLEHQFTSAINKYWGDINFNLILYSTPPITFTNLIKHFQKKSPVKTYLLLKDIFPQNAIDLGVLKKTGLKGLLYTFFRKKEKELYRISDYIGCMSPANVQYILKHNPEIDPNRVEVAPNSYNIQCNSDDNTYSNIRQKYNLPENLPIFIYGGNMGKPQGIPFLINCLNAIKDRTDCHFVIVGDGTEFPKISTWFKEVAPKSVSLFNKLPKLDYDALTNACDVGLIFLDYRFTIPNYPSRLLPYLIKSKPIIAATDPNCDVGTLAEQHNYGFYCPSNSVSSFVNAIDKMLVADIKIMGQNGYQFYLNNYTIEHTYQTIIKHFK